MLINHLDKLTRHTQRNRGLLLRCARSNKSQDTDSTRPVGAKESFLSGTSTTYVEDMYKAWLKNPKSVHKSWDTYFCNEAIGKSYQSTYQHPVKNQVPLKEYVKQNQSFIAAAAVPPAGPTTSPSLKAAPAPPGGAGGAGADSKTIEAHLAVQAIIRSYQTRGHLVTPLDPLGIIVGKSFTDRDGHPPDTITTHFKEKVPGIMNTKFKLPPTTKIGGREKELPLSEIVKRLETVYCRNIAVEYMHILDVEQCNWIREKLEPPTAMDYVDKEVKRRALKDLTYASGFETFLQKKFGAEKRFGLEGCEALIPAVKTITNVLTDKGVDSISIGMAHRGRLNALANICQKPLYDIFAQFHGLEAEDVGSGDVKYHLGTQAVLTNSYNQKKITISVFANPSHLELTDSALIGRVKCEQFMRGDATGSTTCALFIHGDAAFCGQGIVYETFHLSYLPCYTTFGTIHLVVNNQVGFTTDPRFSRSSRYCTDVAHVVKAPIFHVNADHPDSVVHVCQIAAEYRQKFHKDVVVDLVSYRRNGHNEMDEPMFTQPLMYQRIRKHPNVFKLYSDKLIKENVITQAEIDAQTNEYMKKCEEDFAKSKTIKTFKYSDWLDSPWKGFFKNFKFDAMPKTGLPEDTIKHIAMKFSEEPPNFEIHKGIKRILKGRRKMVDARKTDWALGEAFAYTSLMKEGVHVRLSGQDVERGTFSHRHHVLHHQSEDMKTFNMLENIFPQQAPYSVCNSSLSEYGVVGFEVGYALMSPHNLVMWEGQFGDFYNNSQPIVDQLISSQQSKWVRQCGIVMQLPHGMEGMGPEHSSGRMERFLLMTDEDLVNQESFDDAFVRHQHLHINWFVANCSTPASLFHILRRQMKLPFRKPLILFTPKSLLRHPRAQSSFDEFLEGTEFRRVIPDAGPASKAPDKVKKLIFCCGKTVYDVLNKIEESKLSEQIAVARTEQLAPFPYDLIAAEMKKYPNAKVCWAQEEHKNQGAWLYMKDRLLAAGNGKRSVQYIGRAISASAATGNKHQHLKEMAEYLVEIVKIS